MRKKNIICFLLFLTLNSSLLTFNSFAQWIQQSVPVTSGQFFDMKFVNANTGFIAHSTNVLLKTTDAGYNWVVNKNGRMSSISIIDSLNYYGIGYNNQYGKLYKTTNGGQTWDSALSSYGYSFWKSWFVNKDTGVISSSDSYNNQIWRTTDGGQTKQLIQTFSGATQGTFFFLKEKVNGEYYGWMYKPGGMNLYLTTNSGLNWQERPGFPEYVNSVFFINKDTGWASINNLRNYVFYTTNGGNNWVNQSIPYTNRIYDIHFANEKRGWMCTANNRIYATNSGGFIWGTQNLPVSLSSHLFFIDSLIGWSGDVNQLAYTTNGGGPITSILSGSIKLPYDFTLHQNYPNPFNNSTIIEFSISHPVEVKIRILDITGMELKTLINGNFNKGNYEVKFDAGSYSSGVYFYQLIANNKTQAIRKMVLIK